MGDRYRGRGSRSNPANRFERLSYDRHETPDKGLSTEFYRDRTRTILTRNDSPDIGFSYSVNPYRGCEHGCVYCYARPTHEYLSLSAGLDFESRIFVKEKAPELLRAELSRSSWKPQAIALSGITDPYQPGERHFRLTRRCLEVLNEFRNPASVVTKSHLVVRDADLLAEMASRACISVSLSITTLRSDLHSAMEPRSATPMRRLDAVSRLSERGVPVQVLVSPIIPGLTDYEIPSILKAASEAGAESAGFQILRLPHGVKDLFDEWLGESYPERSRRVTERIREVRGGKLNDSRFHQRMKGSGIYAEQVAALFHQSRRKWGLSDTLPSLSVRHFRRPATSLPLFRQLD